jgi:ATP-dependent exoDNAse (exonuclease V) beta subunit
MTIHGAKGLEFDHVFVVGVGRRVRGDDARLLNWLEIPRESGGDHLLMAPIRARGEVADPDEDAINRYLRLLRSERQREERSRLAYVALTRARRTLHLYVHPRMKETEGVAAFSANAGSLLQT